MQEQEGEARGKCWVCGRREAEAAETAETEGAAGGAGDSAAWRWSPLDERGARVSSEEGRPEPRMVVLGRLLQRALASSHWRTLHAILVFLVP